METLKRLQAVTKRLAALRDEHERLIAVARAEGYSLREVGAAAGVSHVAIAKKERGR